MALLIGDCEVAPNYFLALLKHLKTGQIWRWELHNNRSRGHTIEEYKHFLETHTIIGFNWNHYDFAVSQAYINKKSNAQIKEVGDWVIERSKTDNLASYQVLERFGLPAYHGNVIDLMPVAPLTASLKVYAARARSYHIQDLPYHHTDKIDEPMREKTLTYCEQDLDNTRLVFDTLRPEIQLRRHLSKEYGADFLSYSDAQIAEKSMRILIGKSGEGATPKRLPESARPKPPFNYTPPEYIKFQSVAMNMMLNKLEAIDFGLDGKGDLALPDELKEITTDANGKHIRLRKNRFDPSVISYRGFNYKVGIGGLHSQETEQYIKPAKGESLWFADVASYYPSLALTNNWFPEPVGERFIKQYRKLVAIRLAAKAKAGQCKLQLSELEKLTGVDDEIKALKRDLLAAQVEADSLKIIINSIFGKTGNRHSAFYDPSMLLHITLTGQLALLLLIEMITATSKCIVYSANTDGVLVWAPNSAEREKAVTAQIDWQVATGLVLEEEHQKAVASRDVNNYVAIGIGGKVKGKGVFAPAGLKKSPAYAIIPKSVAAYIDNGKAIDDTIDECEDLFDFVNLRKSTSGAMWRGENVGVTCRWYAGVDGTPLTTVKKGSQVANSEKAILVQTMPTSENDITAHLLNVDRDYYKQKANALLAECGVT